MNFNSSQLWILLVFVGLSLLQWIIRKSQEQASINKQKQAALRRTEEALRTGRDPSALDEERKKEETRQRDLAAARQATLREIRRQQTGAKPAPKRTAPVQVRSTTVPPQRPAGIPGVIIIGPGGKTTQVRPPTRPSGPPKSAPQRAARTPSGKGQQGQRPSASRQQGRPPTQARPTDRELRASLQDTSTPIPAGATTATTRAGDAREDNHLLGWLGLANGIDARRAFVLGEIFGPPAAFRDDAGGPRWT